MFDIVELIWCAIRLFVLFICNLPNLKNVVFGTGSHHETLIEVPRDILDLGCVTAVKENQLRRTISLLFFCLLGTALGKIPHHDSTICG